MIADERIQAMIVGNEDFSYSKDHSVNNPASIPNCIPLVSRFCNAFYMVFKQKPVSMNEST